MSAIVERIESKTPEENSILFSSISPYERDSDFFGFDLDLTGIPVWNSWGGSRWGGTMITRRHGVVCGHIGIFGTPTIRFAGMDGEVFERTIVAYKKHPLFPQGNQYYPDIGVYVLNEDLPAEIKSYKILPPNFSDYLPDEQLTDGKPLVFGTTQFHTASVNALWHAHPWGFNCTYSRKSVHERSFFKNPVAGDSSSPYFFVINDEPVLAFMLTGSGGTKLHPLIADINQLIVDVDTLAGFSTGYTVETADLTGFPTYDA